jgi:hypothetical protein
MNVKFFVYETTSSNGLHRSLWRTAGADQPNASDYNKYLLSAINTDFSENRYGDVDETLAAVEKIERGEIDEYDTGGQGFCHHITRDRVRFEHSVFGECPEWPIWCCTLAQYKAALQGYRRFLDMPESIESELIIDLPDGEARCD